ncbi:MAG: hypothetical protein WCC48_01650 [Anaeromyxobacteraceae bacterium]
MTDAAQGFWFSSSLFEVEAGEDEETNPGRYGRRLATWLADRLREHGLDVESVTPEDWGWRVACRSGPHRLIAACGNVDEAGPDHAPVGPPASVTWHCFAVSESSLWRRLFQRAEAEQALEGFSRALREIFESEPRIQLTGEP